MTILSNNIEEPAPSIHVGNVETRHLLLHGRVVLFKWRRIINEERLPLNVFHRYKAPRSAILAEIPIVAHDEKMVRWNLGWTVVASSAVTGITEKMRVWICYRYVIDEHLLLANLDGIASHRHHTLYEIFAPVFRPNKYDDVPRLRNREMRPTSVCKRNAN